jgi:hypothetical protein
MSSEKNIVNGFFERKNQNSIIKGINFTPDLPERINNLFNIISKNNPMQSGISFEKFIELVNKNKLTIEKLTIVDTSYLYRHYDNENNEFNKNWFNKNKLFLDKLTMPYDLVSWKMLIELEKYKFYFDMVVSFFNDDQSFKEIVQKNANKYSHYNGVEAAINFSLEEGAVSLMLKSMGSITYPGKLNDVIHYCFIKAGYDENSYIKYKIRYKEQTVAQRVSCHLGSIFLPKEKQEEFLKKFILLCEEFKNEQNIRQAPQDEPHTELFLKKN